MTPSRGIVAVELFGCSGGMAQGFRQAGIEFIASFDINADACESYKRNLGRPPIRMDARDLRRLVDLGAHRWDLDLLVADPPCTPWSRAGKRLGLDDERDTLSDTAQVIEVWRPRCWLVGNVPGLDDAPNTSERHSVLGPLSKHYCIDYASLDAAAYGVPQHRVRPFWFGHPWGSPCIRWPGPTNGEVRNQMQIKGTELEPYVTVRQALAHLKPKELGHRIVVRCQSARHDEQVLRAEGDSRQRPHTRSPRSDGALLLHDKHPINRPDSPSYAIRARDGGGAQGAMAMHWPWDRPSTTLTTRDEVAQCHRSGNRGESQSMAAIKLSERAAAVAQGFPEGWQFAGKTKRSRWAQLGQVMPPPLAAAIASAIRTWLDAEQCRPPSSERAVAVV